MQSSSTAAGWASPSRKATIAICTLVLSCAATSYAPAQAPSQADREIRGAVSIGERAVRRSTAEIMSSSQARARRHEIYLKRELEIPGREGRPQHPAAKPSSHWPERTVATTSSGATPQQ